MPCARRFLPALYAVTACVILLFTLPCTCAADEETDTISLTILHTNDVHGMLMPFDYEALGMSEKSVGGAARRATLIRELKKEIKNPTIVMDAGDVFARGPWEHLLGVPDIEAMNMVPYDIMALGNSEFYTISNSNTRTVLLDRIRQAKFPIVSANVFDKATGKTIVPAYKVLTFKELRVGILGLTTQKVASYPQAQSFEVRNPVDVAKQIVPELKDKCDFLIALTHIGYPADAALATAVPQIDLIVGGDTHTWVFQPTLVSSNNRTYEPWEVGGTIVVQDGEWGKCVGRIDLKLRKSQDNRYRAAAYSGKLIDVDSSIEPARDVEDMLKRHLKQ